MSGIGGTRLGTASAAPASAPDEVFLNRLSFGANPVSRARLASLGREGWLEEQLALAPEAGLADRLAAVRLWIEYEEGESDTGTPYPARAEPRPLQWLGADPAELVQLADYDRPLAWEERVRPASEVRAVSLLRAVHGEAQLREVMCQFWHDHFNVSVERDELTAALFVPYDAGMRRHALGNFRALLGHVAHAPAMLRYLSNDESAASPANENFARELMELHTLGRGNYLNNAYPDWHDVPGAAEGLAAGYIEDDVYEVARAFTGWSIGDGREYDDGAFAPLTGEMAYIEAWHDPYQKRILAVEFPDHAAPMEDGERVLDLLAAHPGTARFVSGKIMRRLGLEAPSADYAAAMALVFHENRDAPDQIARVIRAIVAHPEFDATPPTKLRRPFEFLAALLRMTGAEVSPRREEVLWLLQQAGWAQHAVAPPTGHSDETADWANTRTVQGLVNLALDAHADWLEYTDRPLRQPPAGVGTLGALASHWEALFGLEAGMLKALLREAGLDARDGLPEDRDWFEEINTGLVAMAALDARFLYR